MTMLIDRFNALAALVPQGFISLLARLVTGLVFFKSGLTKLDGFRVSDAAVFLFREEYKLPVLDPVVAAHLATAAELGLSSLLFIGLGARFAALGLLVMTLVIQLLVYPGAYVTHGLWAVALLSIMAHGAGWLSLDRLLARRNQ